MAQNVTIAGASYSDVPSIQVPKTGGGTASFIDTTIASNAASASDIVSGKMAWVNGTLITGTGSGGGGDVSHNLPDEYQEVRFIVGQETNAVIDTGIQPDETTYAEFKFIPLASTGDVLLGTKGTNDSSDWRFFNYSNGPYWDYWNKRLSGSANSIPLGEIAEFRVFNGGYMNLLTGDGRIGDEVSEFDVPYNIYINGGSTTMSGNATWYYVTIYKGGQKVREYIPCYRANDGVVGMYDLISNSFSTSAGSGSFFAGPDIGGGGASDFNSVRVYIEQDQEGYLLLTDAATIPTAVGVSF